MVRITRVQEEGIDTRRIECRCIEFAIGTLETVAFGVSDVVKETALPVQLFAQFRGCQAPTDAYVEGQVVAVAVDLVHDVAFLGHPRVVQGDRNRNLPGAGIAVEPVLERLHGEFTRADWDAIADPGLF